MSKTVTISLSRAHKLSERLTRHIDKVGQDMEDLCRYVSAQTPLQADKAATNLEELNEKHAEIQEMMHALSLLREAISTENEKVGIHSRLALYKAENRQMKTLEQLLNVSKAFNGGIQADEAKSILKGDVDRSRGLNVQVVDQAFIDSLQDRVTQLSRSVSRLGDEINDLNAKSRVDLSISDKVADVIGL